MIRKLIFLSKRGYQESDEYNDFWSCSVWEGSAMKYVFIRDHRGVFPVDLMCRSLGVVSSGFYALLKRPESPRRRENLRDQSYLQKKSQDLWQSSNVCRVE